MPEKLSIQDLSRQPLVRGTSGFTDPSGNVGYKNEDIQVSALVRIASALEQHTEFLKEPNPLSLAEYGELHVLQQDMVSAYSALNRNYSGEVAGKLLRFCELVNKLLSGTEGGARA